MNKNRCRWCIGSQVEIDYHDHEWGVPLHNDKKLFEFLILDAFQAGLSWKIILNKRENFRAAFDNFDPEIISNYSKDKIDELLQNPGIIRNKLKITASIDNAKAFLKVKETYGSFDQYIWQFTDHKTINNKLSSTSSYPTRSAESDAMSISLKKLNFKFTGTTICYAFMQAAGMINDHETTCFRYYELTKK